MVSKNNLHELLRQNAPKKQRFTIRHLTIGATSVLLGFSLLGGVKAHADSTTTDSNSDAATTSVTTQQNQAGVQSQMASLNSSTNINNDSTVKNSSEPSTTTTTIQQSSANVQNQIVTPSKADRVNAKNSTSSVTVPIASLTSNKNELSGTDSSLSRVSPIAKDYWQDVGGTVPNAKDMISNASQLPTGTTYSWIMTPDVSHRGSALGEILVTYPDDYQTDVWVQLLIDIPPENTVNEYLNVNYPTGSRYSDNSITIYTESIIGSVQSDGTITYTYHHSFNSHNLTEFNLPVIPSYRPVVVDVLVGNSTGDFTKGVALLHALDRLLPSGMVPGYTIDFPARVGFSVKYEVIHNEPNQEWIDVTYPAGSDHTNGSQKISDGQNVQITYDDSTGAATTWSTVNQTFSAQNLNSLNLPTISGYHPVVTDAYFSTPHATAINQGSDRVLDDLYAHSLPNENEIPTVSYDFPGKIYFKISYQVNTPTGQDVPTTVGNVPSAESGISNTGDLPAGTTYAWLTTPDVSQSGTVPAVVVVTYPDGSTKQVHIDVIVSAAPTHDDHGHGNGESTHNEASNNTSSGIDQPSAPSAIMPGSDSSQSNIQALNNKTAITSHAASANKSNKALPRTGDSQSKLALFSLGLASLIFMFDFGNTNDKY